MNQIIHLRRLLILAGITFGLTILPVLPAHAQKSATSAPRDGQKPMPMKPDAAGLTKNHRLILKDGTFQMVRQYTLAGDRVRYLSLERGEWEEMPANLVDWDATAKWERDHEAPSGEAAPGGEAASDSASPAMKEAEEVDKEELAERELQKARMPEVSAGLELPDQDSVFVLDTYEGSPELAELIPNDLDIDNKAHKGLKTLNPLATAKLNMELQGQHAKVHLHVDDPTIFVSLGVVDDKEAVLSHAMTINTSRANAVDGKRGAHSDKSGFAIIRLDARRALRLVGAINVSPTGKITQDENVIPAKIEVMPGKHWLKIQPEQKLTIGEYALIEIISPSEINQSVWDFSVNPAMGDNPGSIGPLLKQTSAR
jgi:hypothetical protein